LYLIYKVYFLLKNYYLKYFLIYLNVFLNSQIILFLQNYLIIPFKLWYNYLLLDLQIFIDFIQTPSFLISSKSIVLFFILTLISVIKNLHIVIYKILILKFKGPEIFFFNKFVIFLFKLGQAKAFLLYFKYLQLKLLFFIFFDFYANFNIYNYLLTFTYVSDYGFLIIILLLLFSIIILLLLFSIVIILFKKLIKKK
jgi:hypothetical protein